MSIPKVVKWVVFDNKAKMMITPPSEDKSMTEGKVKSMNEALTTNGKQPQYELKQYLVEEG